MDLRINYEETISTGNQVKVKGNEFQEQLDKIKAANTELESFWQGSDSSKYSDAVAQQAQIMQELANSINEIGDFLIKVGNAYKEAMENNANAIRG